MVPLQSQRPSPKSVGKGHTNHGRSTPSMEKLARLLREAFFHVWDHAARLQIHLWDHSGARSSGPLGGPPLCPRLPLALSPCPASLIAQLPRALCPAPGSRLPVRPPARRMHRPRRCGALRAPHCQCMQVSCHSCAYVLFGYSCPFLIVTKDAFLGRTRRTPKHNLCFCFENLMGPHGDRQTMSGGTQSECCFG